MHDAGHRRVARRGRAAAEIIARVEFAVALTTTPLLRASRLGSCTPAGSAASSITAWAIIFARLPILVFTLLPITSVAMVAPAPAWPAETATEPAML